MMETSRLMLALILSVLAAVVSAELADDFNIPKGWRMQVDSQKCLPFRPCPAPVVRWLPVGYAAGRIRQSSVDS